jgi:hypothetical protein
MKQLLISLFLLAVTNSVSAANVVDNYVENAQLVGEGRLSYMFWDVYDASLIAPNGIWQRDKPFALKLHYLRKIDGKKIAERSVDEMRGLGITDEVKLATWHSQMRKIFPDVDDGTYLIGIRDQDGNAIFYSNDQQIGRINDVEFTNAFFDIWLNDKTTSPKLRRKLLGQQ